MSPKEIVQGWHAVWAYLAAKEIALWEKLLTVFFVLAYIISPIDLIPDAPIIGWIDDVGIGVLFVYFCKYRVNRLAEEASQSSERKMINITPEKGEDYDIGEETHTTKPFCFVRKNDKGKN